MVIPRWQIARDSGKIVDYFRKHLPNVRPDKAILRLRDAYRKIAREVGSSREKFCAETANIECVKRELGKDWAHIRVDDLRNLIITCAKNPKHYGDNWNTTDSRNHGASEGHRTRLDIENAPYPKDCERRIQEADWQALAARCRGRDGNRCRVCNSSRSLQVHHRTYRTMRTPEELNDLTTLCNLCHEAYHLRSKQKLV